MKYRQFRILQAVSFMTNIPTYSHKGHAASIPHTPYCMRFYQVFKYAGKQQKLFAIEAGERLLHGASGTSLPSSCKNIIS